MNLSAAMVLSFCSGVAIGAFGHAVGLPYVATATLAFVNGVFIATLIKREG